MKQNYFFIALFLIAIFAVMLTACDILPAEESETESDISSMVVRIHIRANSNAEEDQSVKLKVRDEITKHLSERLKDCNTKDEALKMLGAEADNLCQIANSTLYINGFAYLSNVIINKEQFPEKTYDGYVFPEGTYDALILNLGEGVGDNWWCVAFPPLCFVPQGSGEEVVYKSWVAEKLHEIFGW